MFDCLYVGACSLPSTSKNLLGFQSSPMKEDVDEMIIPHLFRCPISLDLFRDPVILCTGQTYDRSSIQQWLAAGNLTCPVTMQKLHDPAMVPNHTLRHFIHQWLQMGNHQFDPDYLQTIDSLASLKHILESHQVALHSKVQALEKIRACSQSESPSVTILLLQLGFLPLLLKLVFGGGGGEDAEKQQHLPQEYYYYYIEFAEHALSCILILLPLGELEPLNMLREESKLASFEALFAHGTVLIRMSLCRIIEVTSTSSETKGLCSMLGRNDRLLHHILVQILQQNPNLEAADAGIKAISALSSVEENKEILVRQGTVNGLITCISSTERREISLAPLAMVTLEKLLELETAKEAVINNPNGIHALIKMVFRTSSDDHNGSESAVSSLIIVCNDSLFARQEAISGGVLTQLLLLLQSQCGGRIKTKARMLLKLLRTKWSQESKNVSVP